jgi:ferrous iron transport protein B
MRPDMHGGLPIIVESDIGCSSRKRFCIAPPSFCPQTRVNISSLVDPGRPGDLSNRLNASSGSDSVKKHILLIGNPNAGKTTLFNRLTGMRQRVGNFPGVTVEKKTGLIELDHHEFAEVVDLPGCYSLAPHTEDEQVVLDELFVHHGGTAPDLIIGVVDASNLSRHLMLILQVLDLGYHIILVINRWDVALKNELHIDVKTLSARLGIPVIPVSATQGFGIDELRQTIKQQLPEKQTAPALDWPPFISELSDELSRQQHDGVSLPPSTWRRIFFTRQHTRHHQALIEKLHLQKQIQHAHQVVEKHGYHPLAVETLVMRRFVHQIVRDIITIPDNRRPTPTQKLDRVLTHKYWGLALFSLMMMGLFVLLFRVSEPMVAGLEFIIDKTSAAVDLLTFLPYWSISLLKDGLIAGVGGVLTFLPQIILLFLFIGLLEDSGYMSRAACVMDRWLNRCGLNGKSMVPMLSSFACAIPGIMATRTIEQPKSRLATALVIPLISCSARLPVYTLVIGAVIQPRFGALVAGLVLFGMHVLGLFLAFPAAWILNRKFLKAGHQPLILEMPDYSWPQPRDLFHRVFNSARSFVQRAGTLIVAISLIIWALIYFPLPPLQAGVEPAMNSARMESSYLGRMGKAVQPIFAPAGYDWKISVGILASFPAREVIIATLNVLYQDGVGDEEKGMQEAIRAAVWTDGPKIGQTVFTLPVASSLLVFIALCMQCGATLITMARETQWRWALGSYTAYTLFAWGGAVFTYQLLNWITK